LIVEMSADGCSEMSADGKQQHHWQLLITGWLCKNGGNLRLHTTIQATPVSEMFYLFRTPDNQELTAETAAHCSAGQHIHHDEQPYSTPISSPSPTQHNVRNPQHGQRVRLNEQDEFARNKLFASSSSNVVSPTATRAAESTWVAVMLVLARDRIQLGESY
jgi:hypothetical protein